MKPSLKRRSRKITLRLLRASAGVETNGEPEDDADALNGAEAALEQEVEAMVSELEAADEAGVSAEALAELESAVERTAEALVTMREARGKINQARVDRQYRAPTPPASDRGKQKQNTKCFDCDQTGHWAGDPQCKHPGAGLVKDEDRSQRSWQGQEEGWHWTQSTHCRARRV